MRSTFIFKCVVALCTVAVLMSSRASRAQSSLVGMESKNKINGLPAPIVITYTIPGQGTFTTTRPADPLAPGTTLTISTDHTAVIVNVSGLYVGGTGHVTVIGSGSYEVRSSDSGFAMYTIIGAYGKINERATEFDYVVSLAPGERKDVVSKHIDLGTYTPPPGYSVPGASSAVGLWGTASSSGQFTGGLAGDAGVVIGSGPNAGATAYWKKP